MADIQTRPLGSTGEEVSIIGLGGAHIGIREVSSSEAVRLVQYAIDSGITFLDNAWEYNDGRSEALMGQAIHGRRDEVFLMTKVCARDRAGAERQLHESLRRLRTDHVDLWQFHEINYGNDAEWIFSPGGAAEAAEKALRDGKVRYVGFTGHKDPAYLLQMLEYDFPWTAVQMPVNVLDVSFRSFSGQVLPALRERGIACLGMKSLGGFGAGLVLNAGIPVENCLRFALSQDIATLICGMETQEVIDQNIRVADSFHPLSAEEQRNLIEATRETAGDGRCEVYKVTQEFDSIVHKNQHFFP